MAGILYLVAPVAGDLLAQAGCQYMEEVVEAGRQDLVILF
jgi:hypothetical protein